MATLLGKTTKEDQKIAKSSISKLREIAKRAIKTEKNFVRIKLEEKKVF